MEIVDILGDTGANVNTVDEIDDTPLLVSVGEERLEMFESMIETNTLANVKAVRHDDVSVLHCPFFQSILGHRTVQPKLNMTETL